MKTIQELLAAHFEFHCRSVRDGGKLLIAQTKIGLLRLTYKNRIYKLEHLTMTDRLVDGKWEPSEAILLVEGKKSALREVIIDLYPVIECS